MGTQEGGNKAAAKNTRKNPRFYSVIGTIGGSKRTASTFRKGFGSDRDRASRAGRIGGSISRRRPALV